MERGKGGREPCCWEIIIDSFLPVAEPDILQIFWLNLANYFAIILASQEL